MRLGKPRRVLRFKKQFVRWVFPSRRFIIGSGSRAASDNLFNGRRIRSLTVVNNFSRECLGIWADQSIRSEDVVNFMKRISFQREIPERLFLGNGPEFIGKALDKWAYENRVILDFSRPGKPKDNAFIESFNGSFRDECLILHGFYR